MTKNPIMDMVERELKRRPDMRSGELHERVGKKHPAVRGLSVRQFHARYPLRVKKMWSLANPKPVTAKKAPTVKRRSGQKKQVNRDHTRGLLVQFAQEILQMRDASFTEVISRVDHYTEELDC